PARPGRKKGAKGRGAGKKVRARSSSMGTRADRIPESVAGTPKPLDRRTNRGRIIEEVESDIDRLIFKLIAVGGMDTIEAELRKVLCRLIWSQGREGGTDARGRFWDRTEPGCRSPSPIICPACLRRDGKTEPKYQADPDLGHRRGSGGRSRQEPRPSPPRSR